MNIYTCSSCVLQAVKDRLMEKTCRRKFAALKIERQHVYGRAGFGGRGVGRAHDQAVGVG